MSDDLIRIITSHDATVRNRSLDSCLRQATVDQLLESCQRLDRFRRDSENLYQRVRALFFLSHVFRYHLPEKTPAGSHSLIPYQGYVSLLDRRFDEAIDRFLATLRRDGPSDTIASALGAAYRELGFQNLADQVRRSVRSTRGNQWMFRVGHPSDHPLRIRSQLVERTAADRPFPLLLERTPVRMDLSHSAWSDIFFLGMDYPEGARVLNVSIDLAVRGRDEPPPGGGSPARAGRRSG